MLLTESEKAKMVRARILDIVIATINEKTGGGTKYINWRDRDFLPAAVKEEDYHKKFTAAIKNYVHPAILAVSVALHGHILQTSVTDITTSSAIGMKYGGAGNSTNGGATARTKDAGDVYDVWDDDWQNQ